MSNVYDELKSRLDFMEDPNWGKYDAAEKTLVAVSEVSAALLSVYRKVRGDAAGQAELSAAIRRLHDEVIAPLDLPGVGSWVEPFIDSQLGVILGGIVQPADAFLDKHLPNPAE